MDTFVAVGFKPAHYTRDKSGAPSDVMYGLSADADRGDQKAVVLTLASRGRGDGHQLETRDDGIANAILTPSGGRAGMGVGAVAIPFDTTQITHPENRSNPQPGDPAGSLAKGGHAPAIAFAPQAAGDQTTLGFDPSSATTPGMGHNQRLAAAIEEGPAMAVRRLTPRECERLQGFPDDYTRIPWSGWRDMDESETPESCAEVGMKTRQTKRGRWRVNDVDGPRYRALGNSMAVPVMAWIGRRIALVDAL